MFQVASHPTSFSLPMDRATMPAPPSLQLPRNLARPAFTEVDRNAITAIAPELANVPFEYIRNHLAGQAPECVFYIMPHWQPL